MLLVQCPHDEPVAQEWAFRGSQLPGLPHPALRAWLSKFQGPQKLPNINAFYETYVWLVNPSIEKEVDGQ